MRARVQQVAAQQSVAALKLAAVQPSAEAVPWVVARQTQGPQVVGQQPVEAAQSAAVQQLAVAAG